MSEVRKYSALVSYSTELFQEALDVVALHHQVWAEYEAIEGGYPFERIPLGKPANPLDVEDVVVLGEN